MYDYENLNVLINAPVSPNETGKVNSQDVPCANKMEIIIDIVYVRLPISPCNSVLEKKMLCHNFLCLVAIASRFKFYWIITEELKKMFEINSIIRIFQTDRGYCLKVASSLTPRW